MFKTNVLASVSGFFPFLLQIPQFPLICSPFLLCFLEPTPYNQFPNHCFSRNFRLSKYFGIMFKEASDSTHALSELTWQHRRGVLRGMILWEHQLTNSTKTQVQKLREYVLLKRGGVSIYLIGHSQEKHSCKLAHFSSKCVWGEMEHPLFYTKKIIQEDDSLVIFVFMA